MLTWKSIFEWETWRSRLPEQDGTKKNLVEKQQLRMLVCVVPCSIVDEFGVRVLNWQILNSNQTHLQRANSTATTALRHTEHLKLSVPLAHVYPFLSCAWNNDEEKKVNWICSFYHHLYCIIILSSLHTLMIFIMESLKVNKLLTHLNTYNTYLIITTTSFSVKLLKTFYFFYVSNFSFVFLFFPPQPFFPLWRRQMKKYE